MNAQQNHLLILSKDADTYSALIASHNLPNLKIMALSDLAEAKREGTECNIILGEPNLVGSILPDMSNLAWVQSTWAGITPFLRADYRQDYQLTGVKDVFGPQMSEYVFCYMLMHERQVSQCQQWQLQHKWNQLPPSTLRGKVIGIMGVGSIGAHIAQTAKYFGMRTLGYTRSSEACKWIDEYYHGDLIEFVTDLDYFVSVLPNTSTTTHLINESVLNAMKQSAILINVGRGNAIDEQALIQALNEQTIGGAVLDVFQQEPLPSDHALWDTPNTIITSHTSAISFPEDIAPIFINNYHRFVNGQALKYLVDFERGY